MPRWLEFALVIAIVAVLALSIAQSATRLAEKRVQLQERVEALLERDAVTLLDFVEREARLLRGVGGPHRDRAHGGGGRLPRGPALSPSKRARKALAPLPAAGYAGSGGLP